MLKTNGIDPEWLATFMLRTTAASWRASADGYVWDIPEWRKLTGQTQAQVEGMGWADAIHPDDREFVLDRWRVSVTEGTPYQVVYRIRLADATYRWFNVTGLPMRRSNGVVDSWFGVCHDLGSFDPTENVTSAVDCSTLSSAHLRAARAALRWSVEDLARKSGISATTVRRMEGESELARTRQSILAKVLKVYAEQGICFEAGQSGTSMRVIPEKFSGL